MVYSTLLIQYAGSLPLDWDLAQDVLNRMIEDDRYEELMDLTEGFMPYHMSEAQYAELIAGAETEPTLEEELQYLRAWEDLFVSVISDDMVRIEDFLAEPKSFGGMRLEEGWVVRGPMRAETLDEMRSVHASALRLYRMGIASPLGLDVRETIPGM